MIHFSNGQFFVTFVLGAVGGTLTFFHAERHHVKHPSAWASFVFLVFIIGLPTYIWYVRRRRR